MAAEWFYQAEGQQWGPIPAAELLRLAEAGVVTPDTAVRKGIDAPWVPAKKVRGLFRQSNPPALPTRVAQAAPTDRSEVTPPPAPPPSPTRPLGATGNAGVTTPDGEDVDADSVKPWWVSRARVGALAIATLAGLVISLLLLLTDIGKLGAASFFVLWWIAIELTPYKPKAG